MTQHMQWILLLVWASACSHRESTREAQAPSAARPVASDATESTKPLANAPLPVRLEVDVSPQGVGLHVYNTGSETLSLAAKVSAGDTTALTLRLDCHSQGCVQLAPGAELLSPPWLGQVEAERCDALYRPAQAGDRRLVVRSCDGSRSAEVPFHWAAP